MKPIIPWNAVEFFANPGKYELIWADGKVSPNLPSLNRDGTLQSPKSWAGMREKTVINKYTKFCNVYRDPVDGYTHLGAPKHSEQECREIRGRRAAIAIATVTWGEES